jgi:multidrug efflux pump subunit AcrA (membrane-fusion protein)
MFTRKRLVTVTVAIVIAGAVAASSPQWLSQARGLASRLQGVGEAPALDAQVDVHDHEGHGHDAHGHEGHDHGMRSHPGHDESNALGLSSQAEDTIGLKVVRIERKTFQRKITVPAMVVERPGRSVSRVTAPLSGIVTEIDAVQGEAVSAGRPLLKVRLTHEELVQAQADLLRSLSELDVVNRELKRIEPLAKDALIPKKTYLERQYEQHKLEAAIAAQRQALWLHGLTAEQVDVIVSDRTLFKELTVDAPALPATNAPHYQRLLQVQRLAVERGQHVTAGDLLCVLTDHAELYIEGTAFEQDAQQLNRAVQENFKVTAVVDAGTKEPQFLQGLSILYVADTVDPESRAFHFYVRLPNELTRDSGDAEGRRFISWRFKPGQRLKLQVPVESWPGSIVLPTDAVVQDGPESFVFQRYGDHFDRRPVRVEYRDPYSVVIANDGALQLGDLVAASGAEQLQLALKNKSGGAIDPHAGHHH